MVRALASHARGRRFESYCLYHIETIGLIPKISVFFSFYRAISLFSGINCLIFGEVALFSLPVLKVGNLSKARTCFTPVNRPLGKDV